MTILTEGARSADFLVSEANGYRSRDAGTVAAGGAPGLEPGTILGRLTAGGSYVRYNPAGEDGSQTVAGILFEAAVGTVERTVVTRDAEVVGEHLVYQNGANAGAIATANAALAARGIIVR